MSMIGNIRELAALHAARSLQDIAAAPLGAQFASDGKDQTGMLVSRDSFEALGITIGELIASPCSGELVSYQEEGQDSHIPPFENGVIHGRRPQYYLNIAVPPSISDLTMENEFLYHEGFSAGDYIDGDDHLDGILQQLREQQTSRKDRLAALSIDSDISSERCLWEAIQNLETDSKHHEK